jgi:hypothetical protein
MITVMRQSVPARDEVGPDTPLRLSVAAALAFPDGSMSASGLRREAARGRLAIERIAGKDYVTLAAIEQLRILCRVAVKDHVSISAAHGVTKAVGTPQSGSSATEATSKARAALHTMLTELNEHSQSTSPKSTRRLPAAKEIGTRNKSQ